MEKCNETVLEKIDALETQLREIFTIVNSPVEKMNYMQLRVSAYRKIGLAVELIDKLLERIETEYITIDEEEARQAVVFLNRQQEEGHNDELREICDTIRDIRMLLISYPENYQNVTGELTDTGS